MTSAPVRLLSVVLSGIVAGVYAHGAIGIPSTRRLSATTFSESFRESIDDFARVMTPLGLTSIAADVLSLVLNRQVRSRAFVLTGAALALNVGAVLTTVRMNVPVNEAIVTWDPENLPSDWQQARERWIRGSQIRTVLGVLGLACSVLATQSEADRRVSTTNARI